MLNVKCYLLLCTHAHIIQVSTNGLISFQNSFISNSPGKFSTSFPEFYIPIIAPLWTNLYNFRVESDIFYRSTNDAVILNRIADMVTNINSNFSTYQPTLAVIVTWSMITTFTSPYYTVHINECSLSFQIVCIYE